MGLRDFFTKSSSNNAALKMNDGAEPKKLELVHDSTKQSGAKKEKLPNALRTVVSTSEKQKDSASLSASIFKLRQKEHKEVAPITHEEIAARAWQIWQNNGCRDGQEVENWLEAEAKLKADRQ